MFAKAIAISTLLAIANAGAPAVVQYANPSVGVQGSNTVRGFAGLSSVTHQAKAVDSPFSTVRKNDTRVTNDAVAYASPVSSIEMNISTRDRNQAVQPAVQYAQAVQPAVQYAQAVQPAVQYAQAVQQAVQYAQAVQPAVQYAQAVQPAVQYAQAVQPAVQYTQAVQPAVQYAHAPVQYSQQVAQPAVAAVSGARQFYNYAPVQTVAAAPVQYAQQVVQPAVAAGPVAYGSKTISGAPVAVQSVAKVAAAPVAYASPTLQYHQPTVYAQQGFAKVATAPVAYATQKVAAVPVARTVPVAKSNLVGVNFSPINPQTASLHFNGFGTSYTLF